jgi:hypothetical protein
MVACCNSSTVFPELTGRWIMVKKLTSLDLGAFHSLDKDKRQVYLGVIDQLRELGVGEDLSLPQVPPLSKVPCWLEL